MVLAYQAAEVSSSFCLSSSIDRAPRWCVGIDANLSMSLGKATEPSRLGSTAKTSATCQHDGRLGSNKTTNNPLGNGQRQSAMSKRLRTPHRSPQRPATCFVRHPTPPGRVGLVVHHGVDCWYLCGLGPPTLLPCLLKKTWLPVAVVPTHRIWVTNRCRMAPQRPS